MYNRLQSPLRRHINAELYHKPVIEVFLFWKSYQGIIWRKTYGPIKICWIQILGIEHLDNDQLSALHKELAPLRDTYHPICIQIWIQEILSAAPASMTTDASYQATCIQLRTWYKQHMLTYGLIASHKENMPPATYCVDLQQLPADLLAACSWHHRTKIKKAQKAWVVIARAQTPEEYSAFYTLLTATGSHKGFGVISPNRYTQLTNWMQETNSGFLYTAHYNEKIIGGAIYLADHTSHEALYLYGATDRSAGNIGASQLLHREAFLDLQADGINHIDLFGGGPTGDPTHHLADVGKLKEWFWPQKIEFAWSYDLVYNTLIYRIWTRLR